MTAALVWQRLVNLKPSLPRHTEFQQRDYNGETWYLLQDKSSGKFHRFNELAYRLLSFMNGRNNLDQVLACASTSRLQQTLEELPTREDLIQLIQYLYVADLLVCDFPASASEIFERQKKKKQQRFHQFIKSPYAWKLSLFNPDKFLSDLMPLAKLLATPFMGVVWLCVVVSALLVALQHWPELTSASFTDIFSAENLVLLWLIYPVFKVLHELGHGLFTKVWGGNVHDFGVVIIAGTPFPYVDATAATGFKEKKQRLMVGAAGMAVELFFAAIALLFWVDVEAGLIKNILFNIILIGSVSTLFFNGNPLMRFDGYHLLCDAIEQPNLATRAQLHLRYLIRHFVYGVETVYSAATSRGESVGLAVYAIAAFIYRLGVLLTIVLVVVRYFPWLGVLLGLWMLIFQLLLPLGQHCIYLLAAEELESSRRRALISSGSFLLLFFIFCFFVPLPNSTRAEGVLWLPDDARIRSESAGEVLQVVVPDDEKVLKGAPLLYLSNPQLLGELLQKQATLDEYQSRYEQAWSLDRSQIQLFDQDISAIQAEIEYLQSQVNNLVVRSPANGTFKLTRHHQLEGSFIQQGDTVGLIINDDIPLVRVALDQKEINRVREESQEIWVQLSSHPGVHLVGQIKNQVPAGTFVLPSPILGAAAGGDFIVKSVEQNTSSVERVFIMDIALPSNAGENYFGQRAHVTFRHGSRPLALQLYQYLQQLSVNLLRGEA